MDAPGHLKNVLPVHTHPGVHGTFMEHCRVLDGEKGEHIFMFGSNAAIRWIYLDPINTANQDNCLLYVLLISFRSSLKIDNALTSFWMKCHTPFVSSATILP